MENKQDLEYQKIKFGEIEYYIVDSMQDFRAEDSFILPSNKLAQTKGNGESKKHVGTYNGENRQLISRFFGYNDWGKEYKDPAKRDQKTEVAARSAGTVISDHGCFFSKSNLLKYLEDAKEEYFAQEQIYRSDISQFYYHRLRLIQNLPDEYIYFTIYDASDNISQKQNRGYIRSDNKIWSIWRELVLPGISYLSILKLVPADNMNAEPIFYFRILLDYQFRSFVHPNSAEIPFEAEVIAPGAVEEVKRLYRLGQEKYRKEVLEYMPQCPFSKITDERLLIASHIKPYNICKKENRDDQALHHLNGLSLSPTYDRLFDQGYITFSDNGELICGTQLSAITWERLSINPNAKNKMRIFPEGREEYLDYHRKHVFLDDVDNIV